MTYLSYLFHLKKNYIINHDFRIFSKIFFDFFGRQNQLDHIYNINYNGSLIDYLQREYFCVILKIFSKHSIKWGSEILILNS